MFGRSLAALVALAVVAQASALQAQPNDQPPANEPGPASAPPEPVIWHDTTFLFQQRATTQTVGIGRDYQTNDPYYDWAFYLRPRLYLLEREKYSLSLRAQGLVTYEFTDSNTTTDRNEVVLEDTILSFNPQYTPYSNGEYLTSVTFSAPRAVIPTSKASRGVGKILELGARAFVEQNFPLREGDTVLPRGLLQARLGYAYTFTNANVPENDDLNRARVDMNGHLVSNDQLNGAALADHGVYLHGILGADVLRDRIGFKFEGGIDWAHKYALAEDSTLTIDTGPVEVPVDEDAPRVSVINYLDASVEFRFGRDLVSLYLGYENITSQIGPDGQRRGFFWSPDAKFYLSVELRLDSLYTTVARPSPPPSTAALASPQY
ncbi:MAG TPA: hypothetical protein VGK73_32965 [Polyangiaceae bacterium]